MQSNPWKLDWKNELQLCKSVVCEGSVLLECPNACGLAHAVQPNGLKAAWQLGGEEHVWEMLARRLIPLLSAVNFLASESAVLPRAMPCWLRQLHQFCIALIQGSRSTTRAPFLSRI